MRAKPQPLDAAQLVAPRHVSRFAGQPSASSVSTVASSGAGFTVVTSPKPTLTPLSLSRTTGIAQPVTIVQSSPTNASPAYASPRNAPQLHGWGKVRAVKAAIAFCHNPSQPMAPYPPGWTPVHAGGHSPRLFRVNSVPMGSPIPTPSATPKAVSSTGGAVLPPGFGYTGCTPTARPMPPGFGYTGCTPTARPATTRTTSVSYTRPGFGELTRTSSKQSIYSTPPPTVPEEEQFTEQLTEQLQSGVISRDMFLFYKDSPACNGVGLSPEDAGFLLPQPGWMKMEEDGDFPDTQPSDGTTANIKRREKQQTEPGKVMVKVNGEYMEKTHLNKKPCNGNQVQQASQGQSDEQQGQQPNQQQKPKQQAKAQPKKQAQQVVQVQQQYENGNWNQRQQYSQQAQYQPGHWQQAHGPPGQWQQWPQQVSYHVPQHQKGGIKGGCVVQGKGK